MPIHDAPDIGPIQVNPAWKIAIVRSTWHRECTEALRDNCIETLKSFGMKEENITVIDTPGSYEIPLISQHAIEFLQVDGVIAFGVVVQGATHHARLIAEQAAAGMMQVQLETGRPITFEVMFVNAIEDAIARSIGPEGKGPLAATTLLSCLAKLEQMH